MLLGVCEWLATKTDFSAKSIRIIFILLVILAGTGVALYLVLWLIKIFTK